MSAKLGVTWLDIFRKRDGTPLIPDSLNRGWLYSYKATDHNLPKPLYKDEDETEAWENPIPIDESGSVTGIYYAIDVPYYLAVYWGKKEEGGQLVTDIDNYSPVENENPTDSGIDFRNYFLNPEFRFYYKELLGNDDLPANVDTPIASEGWVYRRNNTNCDTQIKFVKFAPGQSIVPGNPVYYLEYTCSSIGTGGEESNDIVQIINDVTIFSGEYISFGFYGRSQNASTVELDVIQYFGDGGDTTVISTYPITLTSGFAFNKLENILIPNVENKNVQDGNKLYIGLRMPLNTLDVIGIDKFQWNRGEILLTYDLKSEDQEAISKKSYDLPMPTDNDIGLKIRWNGFVYEFDESEIGTFVDSDKNTLDGYLLCDGASYSTLDLTSNEIVKYDRLFNAWERSGNGNKYGYGEDGFIPFGQYNENAIIANAKIETAITHFADNDSLLTFEVLQEGGDLGFYVYYGFNMGDVQHFINEGRNPYLNEIILYNKNNGVVATPTIGDTDFTLNELQEGTALLPEIALYTIPNTETSANLVGKFILFSSLTTGYYIWFRNNGIGDDPLVPGRTGKVVDLTDDDFIGISLKFAVTLQGITLTKIATMETASLGGAGSYFFAYNSVNDYIVYLVIDDVGDDPDIPGKISVPLNLSSLNTDVENAIALCEMFRSIYFNVPDRRGLILRGTDKGRGLDPDATNRYINSNSFQYGDMPGTIQHDLIRAHKHAFGTFYNFNKGTYDLEPSITQTATDKTADYGGSETRMVNMYTNWFVKY